MLQIRKTALGAACTLALATCAGVASASLPPGISGSWYNRAESGHGLSVEILSPEHALVYWYTYDAEGHPIFLYIESRIEGRKIHGRALAPQGMRFGQLDRADLQLPEWGSVTLEFSDCNTGTLSWDANLPEFGQGTMPLQRLTAIQGLGCDFASERHPLKGLYDVSLVPSRTSVSPSGIAAVDGNGALWAVDFSGMPDVSPAPAWLSAARPCVARGNVNLPAAGSSSLLEQGNTWQAPHTYLSCDTRGWQGEAQLEADGFALESADAADASTWRFSARQDATLVSPVTLADLQGTRSVTLRWQFGELASTLTVAADGALCLDRHTTGAPQVCGYRGRLEPDPQDPGFVNVQLGVDGAAPFQGRGWLESGPAGQRLVLIGSDGTNGMAIVAR